jgi:hypothetical protein
MISIKEDDMAQLREHRFLSTEIFVFLVMDMA